MMFHLTKNLLYTLLILVQQRSSLKAVYDEGYSCGRYTCNGDRLSQPCGCDELCEVYGDCCPDKSPVSHDDGVSSGIPQDDDDESKSHTAVATRAPGSDRTKSIDPSLVSCVNLRFSRSYFLVNRCPTEWNDEYVREMCEEEWPGILLEYLIPVTSNVTGLTYKNTFCAVCHGDRLQDIHMWAYDLDCSSDAPSFVSNVRDAAPIHDGLYNQLDQCDVMFNEPTRRFCLGDAKRCPLTASQSHVATRNCNRFVDYVYVGSNNYQNAYCLECNGLPVESYTCYNGDFTRDGKQHSLSSLADFWVEPDTEFDANLKRSNILNITLEPKLICEPRKMVYTNGRCEDYHCPFGFDHTRDGCKFDSTLFMAVCSARYADSAPMYTSIPASQWAMSSSEGVCNDKSETFRAQQLHPVTNIDMLILMIQDITTRLTFNYRKMAIVPVKSFILTNETMTRFSRNCRTFTRTGSAAWNYAFALIFLRTLNASAPIELFNLTNEIKSSNMYRLNVEICSMEDVCFGVQTKTLLTRDVNAMADNAWTHVVKGDLEQVTFLCKEDIERYEDIKRTERNKNLIQFFINQRRLDNNSANTFDGICALNSLLCVLIVMGVVSM